MTRTLMTAAMAAAAPIEALAFTNSPPCCSPRRRPGGRRVMGCQPLPQLVVDLGKDPLIRFAVLHRAVGIAYALDAALQRVALGVLPEMLLRRHCPERGRFLLPDRCD